MTQEEKAKAYDEALTRAKTYLTSDTPDRVDTVSVITTIFPELAESEEEKIRKNLKHYLEVRRCQTNDDEEYINCNHFLAWLEKQKPITPTNNSEDERIRKEMIDFLHTYIKAHGCAAMNQWIAWLEKQASYTTIVETGDAGYTFDFEKKELKKIEQNPIEDVDLPEFESYLCLMFQKFRTKGMCTNGEIIDYVKEHSQKLRDILVKPAWSEEDEYCRHQLIVFCENCMQPDSGAIRCANWLKSLRPQNHWKPSDEQLNVLHDVAIYIDHTMFLCKKGFLMKLYKQLKKLKKE